MFAAGYGVVVSGYALLAGSEVTLNGAIAGDTVLVADKLVFGSGAGVAGALTIYADKPESVVVPASVALAGRIRIEVRKNYKEEDWVESMLVKVPLWRVPVAG